MDFEMRARTYAQNLSETDKEILSFILANKKRVAKIGISELSQEIHVSNSSIIRFTKKLDLKGFSELKFLLAQDLKQEKQPTEKNGAISLIQLQNQDMEQTKGMIQQTDFSAIIEAIAQADTIYCYGTGFSQKNAISELAQALMYKNKRVLSFPAKREFDMNMPLITRNDLVVIISLTGETEAIKPNIEMLNLRKIPLLSITNLQKNYLAQQADLNLYYVSSPFSYNDQSNANMYSFITLSLVIDTLVRRYFEFYQS